MTLIWDDARILEAAWSGMSETEDGYEGTLMVKRSGHFDVVALRVQATSFEEFVSTATNSLRHFNPDAFQLLDGSLTKDNLLWIKAVASSASDSPVLGTQEVLTLS
jgi:hypothetical protein